MVNETIETPYTSENRHSRTLREQQAIPQRAQKEIWKNARKFEHLFLFTRARTRMAQFFDAPFKSMPHVSRHVRQLQYALFFLKKKTVC